MKTIFGKVSCERDGCKIDPNASIDVYILGIDSHEKTKKIGHTSLSGTGINDFPFNFQILFDKNVLHTEDIRINSISVDVVIQNEGRNDYVVINDCRITKYNKDDGTLELSDYVDVAVLPYSKTTAEDTEDSNSNIT